jgi:Spx/MgsR family transcriptional regulator
MTAAGIGPWEGTTMIEAYVYSSCTSCRKTEEVLKRSGVEYESRDFFRNRFSREELKNILDRAGLSPSDVLSRRSKVYKARAEEIDSLSDDELLDQMVREPTLLRRPLVLGNDRVVIGHNPSQLVELISEK